MTLHEYSRDFIGRCVADQDAYSVLYHLCEAFGPRLSGSEAERRATEFALSLLEKYGCETEIEEFTYSGWVPGKSSAAVYDGDGSRELSSHPLGWSSGTSVKAPIVDVGFGTEKDFREPEIKGKIVLVSSGTKPGGKPLHRSRKYGFAVEAGAVGFLLYSEKPGGIIPMGAVRLDPPIGSIPAIGVSYEDAMHIRARKNPGAIEISTTSDGKEVTSCNGIGLSKGKRSEEIVVCGHMDGWFSPGAFDNGSGIAMLLDLARLLEPYDLARSLRFITFGSEELGLHGSKSYTAARADLSQIACVLNLDCPAVREGELTITTNENPGLHAFFEDLSDQLHVDVELKSEATLYSDHYPFTEAGVPAAQFLAKGSAYIFSHTEYDTLDKVSPESFTVPLILAGVCIIECAMRDELHLGSS